MHSYDVICASNSYLHESEDDSSSSFVVVFPAFRPLLIFQMCHNFDTADVSLIRQLFELTLYRVIQEDHSRLFVVDLSKQTIN